MKQNFLESEGTFYQSFQWVANYFFRDGFKNSPATNNIKTRQDINFY